MLESKLPHESPCPGCGKALDGCTSVYEDVKPKPGDLSACIYCGTLLQFRDDLTLAKIELKDVPAENRDDVSMLLHAIAAAKMQGGRK